MKKSKTDQQNNTLPDTKTATAARRRTIRALGGSGLVTLAGVAGKSWQAPVVKSILLPAHAQATGEEFLDRIIFAVTAVTDARGTKPAGILAGIMQNIMDTVIRRANAGPANPVDIYVRQRAANTCDARVVLSDVTDDPLLVYEKSGIPLAADTELPIVKSFCEVDIKCVIRVNSINGTAEGLIGLASSDPNPAQVFSAEPGPWPPIPASGFCSL